MKKEQKQAVIFGVLILFAVLLSMRTFFQSKTPVEQAVDVPGDVMTAGLPSGRVDFFELEQRFQDERPQLEWVRNPFEFPPKEVTKKEGLEGLNLTGIIYDKESPVAVINDIIVHEGEEIEGAKVLEIRSDSVVFEKEGKTYTLKLLEWEG